MMEVVTMMMVMVTVVVVDDDGGGGVMMVSMMMVAIMVVMLMMMLATDLPLPLTTNPDPAIALILQRRKWGLREPELLVPILH